MSFLIDVLFFLFETVTDFFCVFRDEPEKAWRRVWLTIGGSAVIFVGILVLMADTTVAKVLGWILIVSGFGLLIRADILVHKYLKKRSE